MCVCVCVWYRAKTVSTSHTSGGPESTVTDKTLSSSGFIVIAPSGCTSADWRQGAKLESWRAAPHQPQLFVSQLIELTLIDRVLSDAEITCLIQSEEQQQRKWQSKEESTGNRVSVVVVGEVSARMFRLKIESAVLCSVVCTAVEVD